MTAKTATKPFNRMQVYRRSDPFGNTLIIKPVTKNLHLSLVELFIAGVKRTIRLGVIDRDARVLTVRRDPRKHKLWVANSYGFNSLLLSEGKAFDHVEAIIGDETFVVPKEVLLQEGKFLQFKEKGFERQLFVHVSVLAKFKQEDSPL